MFIKQFLIILGALYAGYGITSLVHMPVPPNVMGLAVLFIALLVGAIKPVDVEKTAEFILRYLALFFVVPAVGIMEYYDVLSQNALEIFAPLIISIILGLFTAGKVTELFIRKSGDDYHE